MMKIEYPEGSTPLDKDELDGLIPQHVTTQRELNEVEQFNIAQAQVWLHEHQEMHYKTILTEQFIKKLHKKMFGSVWRWSGQFRKTGKNIGVDWLSIGIELKKLCDDVCYQIENKTYDYEEIAIRFHHRLVWIHPFSNGNGRYSRVITDILLKTLGGSAFGWGGHRINFYSHASEIRKSYIDALRKADKGQIDDLLKFVGS